MDEISIVTAEDCRVPTCLFRQALLLSITMNHINPLLRSPQCPVRLSCMLRQCRSPSSMRCKIRVTSRLVVAVNLAHLVLTVVHLPQQLTVRIIKIQMHPPTPVTRQQNVTICQDYTLNSLLTDILRHLLLNHLTAHRRQRIAHKDAQAVLMTVQSKHCDLTWIGRHLQTGNISIRIQRNLQLSHLTTTNIKTPYRHTRIYLTGYWILVRVKARIFRIFHPLWFLTFKERHRVLLDCTLVISNPNQLTTVSGENHRAVMAKLLLIHPVWNAIDHLIAPAILRNLYFCIIIQQLD